MDRSTQECIEAITKKMKLLENRLDCDRIREVYNKLKLGRDMFLGHIPNSPVGT